jgi:hypothetical protein
MARAEVLREMTVADLALLGRDRGVRAAPLRRLTDMHHSIARLVAQGEAGYAIALATGYSESRISILKADPMFRELVAAKRAEVQDIHHEYHAKLHAKMVAIGMDALEDLHEDLLEGRMDVRDKRETARDMLDRVGLGPQSYSQSLNVSVDYATQIAEGRQRAQELAARIPEAKALKPSHLTLVEPSRPLPAPQADFRGAGPEGPALQPASERSEDGERHDR